MQTLVGLPHISPSVSPAKPRMHSLAYMSSTSSQGEVKEMHVDIDLDEVIELPKFELEKITL